MKKQNVVIINNINYFKYPEGIQNIEEFVKLLNNKHDYFMKLEYYEEQGCVAPYFIEEDLKLEVQYWNVSEIRIVKEGEIILLRRYEYEEKLKKVIHEKCMNCIHYSDKECKESIVSIYEQIDLDGKCYLYEQIYNQ